MTALTLTEVKNYLRYEEEDTSQDTALGIILAGSQRWVENYTGHIMVQRLVSETPLAFNDYHILRWKPYVAESLIVAYLDSTYTEIDDFVGFAVYQAMGAMRVVPTGSWPATVGGITFTYMAGYEDAYDIPEDLMLGVALHAAMTDEERGDQSSQGWKSLYNLLEQYRMPSLA